MSSIHLSIITPDKVIQREIFRAMARKMKIAFESMRDPLQDRFSTLIEMAILNSPTSKSLVSGIMRGELKGELGVVNGGDEIQKLIEVLQNTLRVTISKPTSNQSGIKGGVKIIAIPSKMTPVFNSGIGNYFTEKGVNIPWLEWLLEAGDVPIIKDFEISTKNPMASRTSLLTMKEADSTSWKVPPQHSGTIQNNFITRAIDGSVGEFEQAIQEELKKALRRL